MKNLPWAPMGIAVLPLLAAGIFGFTDLKSDVRLLDAAWAAGEKNYEAIDNKVGAIQRDLRAQGTKQAVQTQEIKSLQAEIRKLEQSSTQSNREQANMLREILRNLNR